MLTHRLHLLAAGALLIPVISGCGGHSSSDKAGGTQSKKPVVLTLASGNGSSDEFEPFAAAVRRLSGGTLKIRFSNDWRKGQPGYEQGVIRDVNAGKADIGQAAVRAFDDFGVHSFDALNAPLLIDSYALQSKVLASPLPGRMLAALQSVGVVGLGILPGPLRKPLGTTRLVRPSDFRGKTIAIQHSLIAADTLRALGATSHSIARGASIARYDGVEQQIGAIDSNQYDRHARYVTANVTLWPRMLVLFMNARTLATLNPGQRHALKSAAASAVNATIKSDQGGDREALGNLCRRRAVFVQAGAADLATLQRAVQPVYARLELDTTTRDAIAQIRRLRTGSAAMPDAPNCRHIKVQRASVKATPLDGVYRLHTTAADLRAAGVDEAEINQENYGSFKLVLRRGRWTMDQPQGDSAAGIYTVDGNTFTPTVTHGCCGPAQNKPGETFAFHWSLYRDRVTFTAVKGKISPAGFMVKPWRRVGDAP